MGIDKSLVRRHFDRHAHEYEQYASVQRGMAERLAALALRTAQETTADGERTVRRVLEIGCGTGRLTAQLAAAFPQAQFTCVDLSANMIAAARQKLRLLQPDDGRIAFVVGDAEAIVQDGGCALSGRIGDTPANGAAAAPRPGIGEASITPPFDLIVSNAAFQWFTAPGETIRACVRMLRPDGGALAFSTFGPGTFRQLHAAFAEAERLLGAPPSPHGQSFAGGGDWASFFAEEPGTFSWSAERVTELHPDVRSFLRSVKRVGAGNAMAGSRADAGGRRLLESMERVYAERFAAPGGKGIEADYEIVCGIFVRRACMLR